MKMLLITACMMLSLASCKTTKFLSDTKDATPEITDVLETSDVSVDSLAEVPE